MSKKVSPVPLVALDGEVVQPSLVALVSQLVLSGFMLVGAVRFTAAYLIPAYVAVVQRHSVNAGIMCALLVQSVVAYSFMWGLSLLPTCGVRIGKMQPRKTATLRGVLSMVPLVTFNSLLAGAVLTAMLKTVPEGELRDPLATLPDDSTMSMQAVAFLCLGEVWFFYSHWLCHRNATLYRLVHKLHHTWTAPVALEAIYTHPLEMLFVNLVASLGPAYLLGAHPIVKVCWGTLVLVHTSMVHSGYYFASDDQGMHDLHHERFNCNFGVLGVFDYLHGTYLTKGFSQEIEERKRAAQKCSKQQ